MLPPPIVAVCVLALCVVLGWAHARALDQLDNTAPEIGSDQTGQGEQAGQGDQAGQDAAAPAPTSWGAIDLWGTAESTLAARAVTNAMTDTDQAGANCQAFLAMIATSEGTDRKGDPYRVCYGYRHSIEDLSDHPAVTGEWKGESLDQLGPDYVGKISTAAGRYQIIKPTWLACKRALKLPDFSPASQDAAALYLVKNRGALADVQAGRVASAIAACRREWASLPGAGYGQPEQRLAKLSDAFTTAGGVLA